MRKKNTMMMVSAVALLAIVAFTAGNTQGTQAAQATMAATAAGPVVTAQPGQNISFTLLPKNVGNPVFAQSYAGAQEAAAELKSTGKTLFVGPDQPDIQQQIQFIQSQTTQGVNVLGISANDASAVVPGPQGCNGQERQGRGLRFAA